MEPWAAEFRWPAFVAEGWVYATLWGRRFAMPADQDLPKPLQEFRIKDIVAFTEEFRAVLMDAFDTVTENILQTIRHDNPFDDRHVVAAIDFTHVPYHVWPWIDKDQKILLY